MSLEAAMAAVAEVAGEVPGIVRFYPTLQGTISDWPAVMAIPDNGYTGQADIPATSYLHNHNINLWLLWAPTTQDGPTAIREMTGAITPLMRHIHESWAVTPRHRLFSWFRRLGPLTYDANRVLPVGGSDFYGAVITVAVQEEPRVQHP